MMSKIEERENRRRSSIIATFVDDNKLEIMERKRGRPKIQGTEKKQRFCIAIKPSLYGDFQKIAFIKRVSVSGLLEDIIQDYVADNKEALEEYVKLQ